ncbi:ABC transporter G family member 15 [Smittium culicis]|uniref:ABC transporter G family member 15 n=1 Tax=Smittium culicis TaxID=133412 RepID=A0A1R1YEI6_9FUNG|nr:ABC transporter G family member 15 [Smittium culicis]
MVDQHTIVSVHNSSVDSIESKMVQISFKDLRYSVQVKSQVIDASGGKITGEIWANGRKANNGALNLLSRFISQDDVMLSTMTVREVIEMSIKFRRKNITKDELTSRADEAISLLELERCQNTLIGDSISKGISGGERKRVSIAMELATNSSVLLLDEPTSGLDIYTSLLVTRLLKNISRQGQTVVSVIHQPSTDIFNMFDDVVLLSNGLIVYSGPVDSMVEYFSKIGYPCPNFSNPADFVFTHVLNLTEQETRQASGQNSQNVEIRNEKISSLSGKWLGSNESSEINKSIDFPLLSPIKESSFTSSIPILAQFRILLNRASKNVLRNKLIMRARFIQSSVTALLVGIVFYKKIALAVLPMFLVIPLVFGGFLVNTGYLQDWIAWLQWISPIKYGFTLLSINQLKGYEVDGVDIGTPELERLNLGPFGIFECALFLLLFFCILTLLSYYGLHRFMQNTRVKGQTKNSEKKKRSILLGPPDEKFTNVKPVLNLSL